MIDAKGLDLFFLWIFTDCTMGFITIRENQLELFPSIQPANLSDTRVRFRIFLPSKKPTSMITRGVIGTLRACDETHTRLRWNLMLPRRRWVPEAPRKTQAPCVTAATFPCVGHASLRMTQRPHSAIAASFNQRQIGKRLSHRVAVRFTKSYIGPRGRRSSSRMSGVHGALLLRRSCPGIGSCPGMGLGQILQGIGGVQPGGPVLNSMCHCK